MRFNYSQEQQTQPNIKFSILILKKIPVQLVAKPGFDFIPKQVLFQWSIFERFNQKVPEFLYRRDVDFLVG